MFPLDKFLLHGCDPRICLYLSYWKFLGFPPYEFSFSWITSFFLCLLSCFGEAWASLVAQMVRKMPAMWETRVESLGGEYPLGEKNGYPLQYSCLENRMDRGGWQATVHSVTESWPRLGDKHFDFFLQAKHVLQYPPMKGCRDGRIFSATYLELVMCQSGQKVNST